MSLDYIPDHRDRALQDLLSQFSGRPVAQSMIAGLILGYQLLEDEAFNAAESTLLRYASGPRLDILGDLVGEGRKGLKDDPYRAIIGARIRANRSEGTRRDLVAVFDLTTEAFTQTEGEVEYRELYPATYSLTAVTVAAPPEREQARVRRLMKIATPAGVAFRLVTIRPGGLRFKAASSGESTFDGPLFGGLI